MNQGSDSTDILGTAGDLIKMGGKPGGGGLSIERVESNASSVEKIGSQPGALYFGVEGKAYLQQIVKGTNRMKRKLVEIEGEKDAIGSPPDASKATNLGIVSTGEDLETQLASQATEVSSLQTALKKSQRRWKEGEDLFREAELRRSSLEARGLIFMEQLRVVERLEVEARAQAEITEANYKVLGNDVEQAATRLEQYKEAHNNTQLLSMELAIEASVMEKAEKEEEKEGGEGGEEKSREEKEEREERRESQERDEREELIKLKLDSA